jgi:hypothetical protein
LIPGAEVMREVLTGKKKEDKESWKLWNYWILEIG